MRLGNYEILSPLGAGGMGEVYRARDTKLGRTVAVKVLPAELSADPAQLRRFGREARAVSALQHPNIVAVYDVGQEGPTSYIAMELVEGRTLRDALAGGPLPVRKLLDIALQIADALAAAHETGIIHRDVKPSNVVLSKDGFVKLLDFGLSKRPSEEAPESDSKTLTESPSETAPGLLVGTVEYMSPEQASGRPVDFRSDQFSFGVLLYEMATGRRPFRRGTTTDTLVAILRDEPVPVEQLRPDLPPPLRWLIERCLAKVADERSASTRDLARDLRELRDHFSEIQAGPPEGNPKERGPAAKRALLIAAPVLAALLVAAAILMARRGSTQISNPVRFPVFPPEHGGFNFDSDSPAPVAISADGRKLIYGVRDRNGRDLLWVRLIEDVEAKPLPGTEGATYPFWSPDGRFIGFFADGKLKKIGLSGGPSQTLSDARSGRGGAWSREGVILFAPETRGPLYRVGASGGDATAVTHIAKPNVGETHRWPVFLPDGRHFLYTVNDQGKSLLAGGIYVGDLGSKEAKRLVAETSSAAYAPPGYVLFARGGALLALPFDPKSLKSTGEPVMVADRVDFHPYRWNAVFAVSETGSLTYVAGPSVSMSQLVWLDRLGRRLDAVREPADYGGLRLSPSGDRCAVEIRDSRSGTIDIWVLDLERGSAARLTSGAPISDCPAWSPDESRIAFTSDRQKRWDIYERSVTGTTREQLLLESEGQKTLTDWSPDGRFLVLTITGRDGFWLYSLLDRRVFPYFETSIPVAAGRFSPDGRWMAYVSEEAGRPEVYVSPFPKASRKWQISTAGGSQPVWSRNGRELYFLTPDRKLVAAKVATMPEFHIEAAQTLFEVVEKPSASDIPLYDVRPDGSRFLVNIPVEGVGSEPLTVVLNWMAGLPR
jgi:eukaryotic-like serine/threonine-protein kinase